MRMGPAFGDTQTKVSDQGSTHTLFMVGSRYETE